MGTFFTFITQTQVCSVTDTAFPGAFTSPSPPAKGCLPNKLAMMMNHIFLAAVAALPLISAAPAPAPEAVAVAPEHPLITPAPVLVPTKTSNEKRGIISDIEGQVSSLFASASADYASVFSGFPVGGDVQSKLGLDSSQIAALPTQVLNIPYVQHPHESLHAPKANV